MTTAEALAELTELAGLMEDCERRWHAAIGPGRFFPPDYIHEEIGAEMDAYADRRRELKALLAQEMAS